MSHQTQHDDAPRPDPATMTEAQYQDYMADPHAFHPDHHGAGEHGQDGEGHHVTSKFLMRAVLGILVFFTILTVASSRAEIWVAETFDIVIPTIVNVIVAMSIATIKAVFVLAIFMHLKWDNRLNMMVFLFTLMGVGLFIGLTTLDLGSRGEIYKWQVGQIHPGGMGSLTRGEDEVISVSMVEHARNRKIQEIGEAEFQRKLAAYHPHPAPEPLRSPDRSRATQGLTAGLFSAEAPQDEYGYAAGSKEGDTQTQAEEHDGGH